MARKRIILRVIVLFLTIFLHFSVSLSESEADILVKFKESLENTGALSNWNNNISPCKGDDENWVGIFCWNGTVWGLQLENMGLGGTIDMEALTKLPNLRTMSFMNNNFEGPLPNLTLISGLKSIYLSNNKFSGEIPSNAFNGMLYLKKVHLANNQFSGPIPASLAGLPKLIELMLENNQFDGEIPMFAQDRMRNFNVSHNQLVGEIPLSLNNFSASAFDGNRDLCGVPLASCSSPDQLTIGTIIMVAILVAAALAALVVVVIILRRRTQPPQQLAGAVAAGAAVFQQGEKKANAVDLDRIEQGQAGSSGSSSPEKSSRGKKSEPNMKITFLREDREKFDMADLLKASAEILGSGVFGSTYKAALNDGQMMVVKRFRYMNNVNKEEFYEHMRRLGRLNHPNLLPIVGFYYRKEEKLLVADYMERVSLAVHLHGNRSRSNSCPDWPTRLKILKGVVKGLLYLYNELPSLTAPHGHLKSSNVLLDRSYTPLLTDYGLVPVVNPEQAQEHMISYKSPEYKTSGRITKRTDIWSLGILIIETLTGKFPSNFLQQGKSSDTNVAAWVESVTGDDGDMEVFDADMDRTENAEGEMMKLLKIGLDCCQTDADRRPDIKEVAEMIEEVKEKGS
ncbi:Serine/threonine protein kinase [Handroanthus impetiginosus]|uniref:Serine/threonine protein kinase n=1 Tax=Handroanthus impetiginosus TaxID=429701 RepID=A0A2G9GPG4_9LAMI|nr:Serine/threonine protein kinase [Handroanthus impetiginosus]